MAQDSDSFACRRELRLLVRIGLWLLLISAGFLCFLRGSDTTRAYLSIQKQASKTQTHKTCPERVDKVLLYIVDNLG